MLRIFRLNPKFQLDTCPPNVMYIDIKHEDEIQEKYIKEKQLDKEFVKKFYCQSHPLYRDNYLILRERGYFDAPTVSDVDIVKNVEGFKLPCTFALSIKDLNDQVRGPGLKVTEPLVATKHSEFIISIRSIYSNAEKLTVDQNEALMCCCGYYYPRPLPRIMLVDEDSNILPPDWQDLTLGSGYNRTVNYKGNDIVPVDVEIADTNNENDFRVIQSYSNVSDMYFVLYDDNEISVKILKDRYKSIQSSIDKLPPPIHSNWLVDNVFCGASDHIKMGRGELASVQSGIMRWRNSLKGPYENAVVPGEQDLDSFSS